MVVIVDMKKCIGSGMCTSIAADVFKLDENGKLVLIKQEITSEEMEAIRDAVFCCPVEAISLAEGK